MAPVSERELGKRAPTVLGFFKNILKKWMFSLIQARRVSRGWLGILGQQFLGGLGLRISSRQNIFITHTVCIQVYVMGVIVVKYERMKKT